MNGHLRRPALKALALCLLALPTAAARAQEKPAQPPTPNKGDGGMLVTRPDNTSAPRPDGPFRPNEVTKKAIITYKPAPGYTTEALDNDVYGVVRLRAVLTSTGQVTNISVVRGLPDGLTEKAVAVARQIRFTPAEKDGRKVSIYVTLEYNFNHDDELAKIVEQPRPEYTEAARRNRVSGKVVLLVTLNRDGTVGGASVLEGLPDGLSEKAVEAALKIKFVPAEVWGRKVTVVRKLVYNFSPD